MDTVIAILVSGVTSGALYALAALGLSIIWGTFGMLNMAHGVLLTIGGYAAYSAVTLLGMPYPFGVVGAALAGAAIGGSLYALVVRHMMRASRGAFEINIVIATFGIAIALENSVLRIFGGQPLAQPVTLAGSLQIGTMAVPLNNVLVVCAALMLMTIAAGLLKYTRAGRAVRATAQSPEAAQLLGVPVRRVYAQVMVASGILAGICGMLISSITQLSPTLGADPLQKAFIMCVVAGFGNLPAAVGAAFALALVEVSVDYLLSARWGFPLLLFVVIATLIWRPNGVFGRPQVRRL
jgi:branched-chain amino acid transport system permease protein